jgi:hypothetical protein
MGTARHTSWPFSLDDLYPDGPLSLESLCEPFQADEINTALSRMQNNASPGPDGFGPLFFKKIWRLTSPAISDLFHDFYFGTVSHPVYKTKPSAIYMYVRI